MFVELCADTSS